MSHVDISYRRIAQIASPVLVTQMSHTAMGVIDTVMVGQLGLTALAAVGLGNLITWWLFSFCWGMVTGVNALVAQAVGAGRPHAAGVAFWQGMYLGGILAVCLAAMSPLAPFILGLTGATPEVLALAVPYMQVRLLGAAGFLLLLVADNFYRGIGRTTVPMYCGLAQLALNWFFNYLLIFGNLGAPRLGTTGAAWGTLAAVLIVGVALCGSLWLLPTYQREFAIRRSWRFEPRVFRGLVRLSLPIGVQTFMEMGGIAVFCALIAQLGDAELAATNAVIQSWSVAFMGALALSVCATTLVGQCVGAGEPDRGREAVRRVLTIGNALTAAAAVVYLLFPEQLMALFVREGDVAALLPFARPLFAIVVVCLFFDLHFNLLSGALRGAGDTQYSMLVNIGSAWLLFVPATYLATPVFGLVGAWACLVLHVFFMAAMLRLRFAGNAWLKPPLAQDAEPAAAAA